MTDYIIGTSDEEYKIAALLFREYAKWLNIDLSFQHFEKEIITQKNVFIF